MAAMPIYGKNRKNIFSGTKRAMTLKRCMQDRVLEFYQVCSNNDPCLTLKHLMARSSLVPCDFVWEKVKTIDFQSKKISNDQELIQSDPTSCPQNQKRNN